MPSAYISFLLFLLIIILGLANPPVFYDPDTAWHLATGDLIRLEHIIPFRDGWSFTAEGNTWYNLSWLFDYCISALFLYGGFSAVYALTILVFAGSLAFMARHCVKRGASPSGILVLLVPVLFVVFTNTLARPNMCSILLTVLFYQLLRDYQRQGKFCHISILPALMAFWVNLHGGFLLAFPVMGFFLVQAIAVRDSKAIRGYGVIIALCLLATLINPYGFGLYYGAYRTVAGAFSQYLMEWKPVEIGHNIPMTMLILLVLCVSDVFDRKIPLSDRLLAVFVTLLSLSSLRHAAAASLLLMPYLALRITSIAYDSAIGERVRKWDAAIMADMQKPDIKIMAVIMALAACIAVYLPTPRDEILDDPAGFRKKQFPAAEAHYVAEHYPQKRFFNSYNIGGYLDYLWRGKVKVFVDGRATSLYSDELLEDYRYFSENHGFGSRSEVIMRQYKLEGLIIANNDKDAGIWNSNPEWKAVYRGEVATVYIRGN